MQLERKGSINPHPVEKYGENQLLVLKLDVTKRADVVDAFKRAKDHFRRIDVVFNNAGCPILGEVEGTSEKTSRFTFEVSCYDLVPAVKI